MASALPTRAPLPPLRRRVAVIAHRGGPEIEPENTLPAFERAIGLGVDYVEVDVRSTSDGMLVVLHDRTVDRTTDGAGAIAEMRWDVARTLTLVRGGAAPVPAIPRLEDVLELCTGRVNVYLDHKEGDIGAALALLRRFGLVPGTVVYADRDGIDHWKRAAPEIPVIPSLPDGCRTADALSAFVAETGAELLDGNARDWAAELVAAAHATGAQAYVDALGEFDCEEGWDRMLEMGIDGIQTDYPGRLLRWLDGLEGSR